MSPYITRSGDLPAVLWMVSRPELALARGTTALTFRTRDPFPPTTLRSQYAASTESKGGET